MPTTVVSSIGTGKDYATWTLWEAATDNDLVTLDRIEVGEGYTETLTGGFVVTGAITDATRYRILRANSAHEHDGIYGTGHQIQVAGGVLTIGEANCVLRDLTIRGSSANTYIVNTTAKAYIERCFVVGDIPGFTGTYPIGMDAGGHIRACLVVGLNRGIRLSGTAVAEVSNCTVIGQSNLINSAVPFTGIDNDETGATTAKNNCVLNYNEDFQGTLTQSNNASSDGSASGAGSITAQIVSTLRFRANVALDYVPRSDSTLAGSGADLSANFNYDIAGNTMPTAWPIGCYRAAAAPTFAGAASATNNSDGSITVAWAAATAIVSAVRGYKVHVHTAAMVDADLDADTYLLAELPSGRTSFDVWTTSNGVTTLTSGTEYSFVVRAISESADEDQNATNRTATPSLTAPTFTGLTSATNNGDGSVGLVWSAATFNGSIVAADRGYEIHVHTATMLDADLDADTYYLARIEGTATSFDAFTLADGVTKLTAGTTYYFAVRAFQRWGPFRSEDQNAVNQSAAPTASVTAPTAAINGHFTSITNTTFTGVLDAFPASNIDRWRLAYRIKNDTAANVWTYSTANTTVTANQTIAITGLTASNTYEVAFQGGNGTSSWGDFGELSLIFTSNASNTWDGTQITQQIMNLIDANLTSSLSLTRVTQYGTLADYAQDRDISGLLPMCLVELQTANYKWARFPKGFDIIYLVRILYVKEFAWTSAVVQDRVDSLGKLVGLFASNRQLGLGGGSTTEGQIASVLVTEAATRPEEDDLMPHDRIFVVGLTLEITARAQA